jgi:hypothetical protein
MPRPTTHIQDHPSPPHTSPYTRSLPARQEPRNATDVIRAAAAARRRKRSTQHETFLPLLALLEQPAYLHSSPEPQPASTWVALRNTGLPARGGIKADTGVQPASAPHSTSAASVANARQ